MVLMATFDCRRCIFSKIYLGPHGHGDRPLAGGWIFVGKSESKLDDWGYPPWHPMRTPPTRQCLCQVHSKTRYLSIWVSFLLFLSMYLCNSIYLSMHLSIYVSNCVCIYFICSPIYVLVTRVNLSIKTLLLTLEHFLLRHLVSSSPHGGPQRHLLRGPHRGARAVHMGWRHHGGLKNHLKSLKIECRGQGDNVPPCSSPLHKDSKRLIQRPAECDGLARSSTPCAPPRAKIKGPSSQVGWELGLWPLASSTAKATAVLLDVSKPSLQKLVYNYRWTMGLWMHSSAILSNIRVTK